MQAWNESYKRKRHKLICHKFLRNLLCFYDRLSAVLWELTNVRTEEKQKTVSVFWLESWLVATSWLSLYQIIVQIHFPLSNVLGTGKEGRGWECRRQNNEERAFSLMEITLKYFAVRKRSYILRSLIANGRMCRVN